MQMTLSFYDVWEFEAFNALKKKRYQLSFISYKKITKIK